MGNVRSNHATWKQGEHNDKNDVKQQLAIRLHHQIKGKNIIISKGVLQLIKEEKLPLPKVYLGKGTTIRRLTKPRQGIQKHNHLAKTP